MFSQLCPLHHCERIILNKCVTVLIYNINKYINLLKIRFIKDNKSGKTISQDLCWR